MNYAMLAMRARPYVTAAVPPPPPPPPPAEGWNISTASYVQSFSVRSQEDRPNGLAFKPDGTRMYVTGLIGDAVNEYSLSSPWDISTASYSQNFDVSSQDTLPRGVAFKTDGTRMYVVGGDGRDINEYSLSSAWDISKASYSQNFSVASEDLLPQLLAFKTDGSQMYVVGYSGQDINEYSLSSPWDISTASYSQNFSVASELTQAPSGVAFKTDGTRMYVTETGDAVVEYSLSTAWDISTASYSQALSVPLSEGFPSGIAFKSDGTQMYLVIDNGQVPVGPLDVAAIYEYSLTS